MIVFVHHQVISGNLFHLELFLKLFVNELILLKLFLCSECLLGKLSLLFDGQQLGGIFFYLENGF